MTEIRLTLYASQTGAGWQIVDNGGNIQDNGQTGELDVWSTRDECMAAIRVMYPTNSVWDGYDTADSGWSILI